MCIISVPITSFFKKKYLDLNLKCILFYNWPRNSNGTFQKIFPLFINKKIPNCFKEKKIRTYLNFIKCNEYNLFIIDFNFENKSLVHTNLTIRFEEIDQTSILSIKVIMAYILLKALTA